MRGNGFRSSCYASLDTFNLKTVRGGHCLRVAFGDRLFKVVFEALQLLLEDGILIEDSQHANEVEEKMLGVRGGFGFEHVGCLEG